MTHLTRRRLASPLLALAAVFGVTACGTSSSADTTSSPAGSQPYVAGLPTLRLDYYADSSNELAKTLDPALASAATDSDTIALVNANLVHILPDGTVAPDLATWTVDQSKTLYTFTIRPNARFANGHPMTASDAVFSIERALAPATGSTVAANYLSLVQGATAYNAGKARFVSGLKALGPRRLQIRISKPAAYFLDALAYPTADVLDPAVVRGKVAAATNNYLTTNCPANQGAGPFKFVCSGTAFYPSNRTPRYTLVPNGQYFGPHPHISLQIPALPSVDVNYRVYEANGIDTAYIPTPDIQKWRGSGQYIEYPTSIVSYITPNTAQVPFNSVHCRLAVAYALDRQTIARRLLSGASVADYAVVPQGFLAWYNGQKSEPHYSVSRARREFSMCPSRNVPVRFAYPTGASDRDNVASAVVAMLTQVGFKASVDALTANDWDTVVTEPMTKTGTQLVRNGWQQDYPDPQDYVSLLLRSTSANNISLWKNAAFDKLVDRADVESNRAARATLYKQAQHIALSQGAWISMTNTIGHQLVKPWVHGLVGTAAYGDLVPRGDNWANVTVSKH